MLIVVILSVEFFNRYAECHYTECHYAERLFAIVAMLSVVAPIVS